MALELTVAVPKGRLERPIAAFLEARGIAVNFTGRELVARDAAGKLRFLLVKNQDLPTYVGHGIAGLGICGDDVSAESAHRFYRLATLPFGDSRLCLVTRRGAEPTAYAPSGVKVAPSSRPRPVPTSTPGGCRSRLSASAARWSWRQCWGWLRSSLIW